MQGHVVQPTPCVSQVQHPTVRTAAGEHKALLCESHQKTSHAGPTIHQNPRHAGHLVSQKGDRNSPGPYAVPT